MSNEANTRQGRRQAKKKKNDRRKPKRGILKKLFIAFILLFGAIMLAGGITVFAIIAQSPEIDPEKLQFPQGAQIFDQSDEFVSQLDTSERRILVNYQDIPEELEEAFISVEDVRFRDHFGIDLRRIGGAIAANITSGFGAEGASTITQQLVKNVFLTNEKALTRKIQEQYLAVKLEQQYSKNQILEMYLNQIYLGQGVYGVEQASQYYFGKSITDDSFSLADAALLAAIPRRPSFYDPVVNPENAESRRNLVISMMEDQGKITAEEAEAARSIPIAEQLNVQERESYPFQAFYNQVHKEVEEMEGISVNDLYNAGLKIYTTLDTEAQQHVEKVLQTDEFIQTYPNKEDFQAGITLVDTQTGEIKAIGSGRENTNVQRGFNYATDIKRQPGSTIKPILDYGPVIEYLQWSTGRIIKDEPHQYSNGVEFKNFDGAYKGNMTMRQALAESRNVPAIKALQEVGVERAAEFAESIGVEIDQKPMHESYGLGGFNTGVSTLDMAGAYAAFGNGGKYIEPHTVRKIEFPDGRVIDTTPESTQAMSDYTAYMISDMLKTAVESGTGTVASIPGLPLAGKTGTTNFDREIQQKYGLPSGAVPDRWFAGYTTRYTAAVWTGFTEFGEENYLLSQEEQRIAMQIFKAVMEEVSSKVETPDFEMPNSVVRIGIEKSTGLLPSSHTPQSEIVYELFVRGTEPTRVSEQFDRLSGPSNLTANYNEATGQIIGSWEYDASKLDEVSFRLEMAVGDGGFNTIDTTKDMQFIVDDVTPGTTYRFRVTAVSDSDSNVTSNSAEVKVTVPGGEEEEPDEEEMTEPDEEEQQDGNEEEDPDQGNDQNNGNEGNNNGNGNGNGNGNNNRPGNDGRPNDNDDDNEDDETDPPATNPPNDEQQDGETE
ncbi:penicillin-binding protein 1A [Halalkalibacterium halodurans]|uniref:penicillin-binding protein 1A n=1 Tax=Halalkalibacterium halodurans TaxID=86665 RepID=UPI0010FE5B78|nr:PBP1A family penicillin-binding protein [Halalkalibacterium halodurans]